MVNVRTSASCAGEATMPYRIVEGEFRLFYVNAAGRTQGSQPDGIRGLRYVRLPLRQETMTLASA
jgi:hypothetical protein